MSVDKKKNALAKSSISMTEQSNENTYLHAEVIIMRGGGDQWTQVTCLRMLLNMMDFYFWQRLCPKTAYNETTATVLCRQMNN